MPPEALEDTINRSVEKLQLRGLLVLELGPSGEPVSVCRAAAPAVRSTRGAPQELRLDGCDLTECPVLEVMACPCCPGPPLHLLRISGLAASGWWLDARPVAHSPHLARAPVPPPTFVNSGAIHKPRRHQLCVAGRRRPGAALAARQPADCCARPRAGGGAVVDRAGRVAQYDHRSGAAAAADGAEGPDASSQRRVRPAATAGAPWGELARARSSACEECRSCVRMM